MAPAAKRQKRCLFTKSQVLACLRGAGVTEGGLQAKKKDELMLIAEENGVPLRSDASSVGLADLPDEIILVLLRSVAKHVSARDVSVLFHLALTCKDLLRILSDEANSDICELAWMAVARSAKYAKTVAGADKPQRSARQKVKLMAFTHCQLCKARPLTKKVYWPFGVRACKDCLYATAFSTKEIKKLTEIPLEECYETGVPYSAIEMCSRWYSGVVVHHFFWGPALKPLLQKYHDVSSMAELNEKKEAELAVRQAAAAERKANAAAKREKKQRHAAEREAKREAKAAENAAKQQAKEEKQAATAAKKEEAASKPAGRTWQAEREAAKAAKQALKEGAAAAQVDEDAYSA